MYLQSSAGHIGAQTPVIIPVYTYLEFKPPFPKEISFVNVRRIRSADAYSVQYLTVFIRGDVNSGFRGKNIRPVTIQSVPKSSRFFRSIFSQTSILMISCKCSEIMSGHIKTGFAKILGVILSETQNLYIGLVYIMQNQ